MKSESLIFVLGIVFIAFLIINNFTKNLEENYSNQNDEKAQTVESNIVNSVNETVVISNSANIIENKVDITAIDELRNMQN